MPRELRRHVRKRVTVEVRTRGLDGRGVLFFDSADLSTGGCFLRADILLEEGEQMTLELRLPGKQPIVAPARIAWVRRIVDRSPSGMGVEFLGLRAEDRAELERFLGSQPAAR